MKNHPARKELIIKFLDKVDDWQQKATFSLKDLSPLYKVDFYIDTHIAYTSFFLKKPIDNPHYLYIKLPTDKTSTLYLVYVAKQACLSLI